MKALFLTLGLALGCGGPALAQSAELSFSAGDGYALVRDAAPARTATECTAPFTPIVIDIQKDPQSGFLASHNFLDQHSNDTIVYQRYGATRSTYNGRMLRVRPPVSASDTTPSESDAVSETSITFDMTLTGCGYGQHLDILDGSIIINAELARYVIDVDETLSDLWRDPDAASLAHYAPLLWSTNITQQARLFSSNRWRLPRTELEDQNVIGELFLDVWMTRPVHRPFPEATLITRIQVGARVPVIDQRDPSVSAQADQGTSPQSRFVSVTPLTDR